MIYRSLSMTHWSWDLKLCHHREVSVTESNGNLISSILTSRSYMTTWKIYLNSFSSRDCSISALRHALETVKISILQKDEECIFYTADIANYTGVSLKTYIFSYQIFLVFYNTPRCNSYGTYSSSGFGRMIFQGISHMTNDTYRHN